ncbi:hypothetical protein Q5752_004570 [Cryptotrichosporon argae]
MAQSPRPSTPQPRRRRAHDEWESDSVSSPSSAAGPSSTRAVKPIGRKVGSARPTSRTPLRKPPTLTPRRPPSAQLAPVPAGRAPPPTPGTRRPTLRSTLGYLLVPLQLLLAPLNIFLAPFLTHALNAALLLALAAGLVYLAALHGFSALRYAFRLAARMLDLPTVSLPELDLASSAPVRAAATPLCFLANLGCAYSYAAGNGSAHAFWARPLEQQIDVARVAVGLTEQVRGAATIFESIGVLAEGELASSLDYTHVLELGVAVKVGSTIEDKDVLADKITELGLLSRDIADGVMSTSTMSNSAIQWLEMDFKRLVDLLSTPSTDSAVVWRRLDRTLADLDRALLQLQERTAVLRELATKGVSDGLAIDLRTQMIHHDLLGERARLPGWKPLADRAVHFVRGGEQAKYAVLSNDIAVTARTLDGMRLVVRSVEEVRAAMGTYRDQLDLFRSSVMGFHLGASDAVGLGPEEEVRTLAQAVEMFSDAAKKGREVAARKREGIKGGSQLGIER